MEIEIKYNHLTPEIFTELRKKDFINSYSYEDIALALKRHLFDVVIFKENNAVAMARLIGDDRISFIIKDFVVLEDYRGQGYANILMKELFKYIDSKAANNAYVGLMSTKGKESFYAKFGFIERPNEQFESGMIMYYERK